MSEVKDFLHDIKPKRFNKYPKDDRTFLLYDNLPMLVEFYIKKGHNHKVQQDEVQTLFDHMNNMKLAKTLLRILKTSDATPIDLGMATIIADFLEKRHESLDPELVELYGEVIDKILKKRIKKLSKKTGLDKDILKEMLVVIAEPGAISDERFVGVYVNRVLRKLYTLAKNTKLELDVDTIENLLSGLFGKELINDVAINVLLERKEFIRNFNDNQIAMWNLLTNFALEVLESNKKKVLREKIEYYVMRRTKDASKGRDSARRIQFAQVSEEDYPKLHKVSASLSEEDGIAKFL
jgi:hypothetical protein